MYTSIATPKILVLDIESIGNMNAAFGSILSFGYLWYSDPFNTRRAQAFVKTITDYPVYTTEPWKAETELMRDVHQVMSEADLLVTFFGKGFDRKFIQTAMLKETGLILPPTPHVDLYFIAKSHLLLGSGSLNSLQQYFELKTAKTHVAPDHWKRAMYGDRKSIDYIVDHNRKDVVLTAELYRLLRPLVRQHPKLTVDALCHNCGSTGPFLKHKTRYTAAGRPRQQVQCTKCHTYVTLKAA